MSGLRPRLPAAHIVSAVVAVFVLFAPSARAQEAGVRASLAAHGDIWVGQRVTLAVELLAPGYFSGAPAFDLPDPQGLLIVPPGGSPTISTEEIEGTNYTVQRHEFSVFARGSGPHTIPPLTARFHFKRNPLDADILPAVVKTDAVGFTAQLPPGAETLGNVISARRLQAVETWNPEPDKAKAGDAFTRTITFTALDVPAMLFPPFPPGEMDGLGIYPHPPEVRDLTERGEFTGQRRDSMTYVCKRPGRFRIPAVRLTWWDLDERRLKAIEFPERILDVAANPALASASGDAKGGRRPMPWAEWLGMFAAAAVAGGLFLGLRASGRRLIALFRPVHLAPLNPVGEAGKNGRERPLQGPVNRSPGQTWKAGTGRSGPGAGSGGR